MSTSGGTVVVQWRANVTDPSSSGGVTANYRYTVSDKDVFVVNPSDPRAVPTGCSATLPPAAAAAVLAATRRVLLARDPLGIKPLYTARVAEKVVFASEVRALLATSKPA